VVARSWKKEAAQKKRVVRFKKKGRGESLAMRNWRRKERVKPACQNRMPNSMWLKCIVVDRKERHAIYLGGGEHSDATAGRTQ